METVGDTLPGWSGQKGRKAMMTTNEKRQLARLARKLANAEKLLLEAQTMADHLRVRRRRKPKRQLHLPADKTVTAMIGRMLCRKNGATRPELLKATGWPALNV